jgi:hypothetical protein
MDNRIWRPGLWDYEIWSPGLGDYENYSQGLWDYESAIIPRRGLEGFHKRNILNLDI